ncbi:hypothetical protein N9370_01550 [Paracoccaceae bacterium]|nr:hypothetical protein [Paracoccaceae bacterium]
MKTYEAVVVVGGLRIDVTVQPKGAAQAKAQAKIEAQYGKWSIKVDSVVR